MVNSFLDCNNASVQDAADFYTRQGLKIVKIQHGEKKPVELDWTNKVFTPKQARIAFEGQFNIGVRGDESGLIGIDCDEQRFKDALFRELPMLKETLQSRGKKETGHCWVKLTRPLKNESVRMHLEDKKITFADLRGIGGQIVVAPSIHPEGMQYQWLNNNQILPLDTDVFLDALDSACLAVGVKNPYRKHEKKPIIPQPEKNIFTAVKEVVRIQDVLGTHDERLDCFVHKEETPSQAMRVYPETNSVYCFSCGWSGDVISVHAKKEGLTQIEAAKDLALKYGVAPIAPNSLGQNFNDGELILPQSNAIRMGQNTDTLGRCCPPPIDKVGQYIPKSSACTEKAVAYAFGEVPQELLKTPEWFIPGIIPKHGKVFIGAPVANYKSTTALYIAARLASGAPFWNGDHSEPIKVLFLDEEDTWGHICEIIRELRESLNEEQRVNLDKNFFIASSQSLNTERREEIFSLVRNIKPEVIFFDSFRKLAVGDESKSEVINQIDSDVFNPMAREMGVTWVLIHHNAKKQSTDRRGADDIELMRGSGAIAGIATIVIMLEKLKDDAFAFYIGKNKWGRPSAQLLNMKRDGNKLTIEGGAELEIGLASAGKLAEEIKTWLLKEGKTQNIRSKEIKEKFGDAGGTTDRAIRILKDRHELIGSGAKKQSPFRFVCAETRVKSAAGQQGRLTEVASQ